jgi:hypothetical protein
MSKSSKSSKSSKRPAAKSAPKSDGLGRPGTVARFFRETILAKPGRENAEIVALAKRKFPKAGIASHWASWYRAEIVRKGAASHRAAYGA